MAGRAEHLRDRGVIHDGDVRHGDGLALAADEQRATLHDRLTAERAADQAEQRAGHQWIEHDRQAARRQLAAPRSRAPHVAASRAASSTSTPEKVRTAEKPLPVRVSAPSPTIAYTEIEHMVQKVRASTPLERDRTLDRTIAVGRRLDATHTWVESLGGRVELEGERDLAFGLDREQLVAPEVELARSDAGKVVGGGKHVPRRPARRSLRCCTASASVSATTSGSTEPDHT